MRDIVEVLSRVTAHYDQAAGGNQDSVLSSQLIGFANDTLDEVNRERRWSLSYSEPIITTVAGTQSYVLPVPSIDTNQDNLLFLKRVYRYDSTTGRSVELKRYEKGELQRVWGDVSGTQNRGKPTHFAVESTVANQQQSINWGQGSASGGSLAPYITLYPCPDAAYTLYVGGYYAIPLFVDTISTTVAANNTVTVPSSIYLRGSRNLPLSGSTSAATMSIVGAGELTSATTRDIHMTTWTNLVASGTTLTVVTAPIASVSNTPTYFNSTNWVITHWPKVLLFGMLREVAAYYGKWDDASAWEAKYQDQLEKLGRWEDDKGRGLERLATAQPGQNASIFRDSDRMSIYDIRGGV